jgi:hypothetical protein
MRLVPNFDFSEIAHRLLSLLINENLAPFSDFSALKGMAADC